MSGDAEFVRVCKDKHVADIFNQFVTRVFVLSSDPTGPWAQVVVPQTLDLWVSVAMCLS